jgi:hypothetical protein
LVAVAVILAAGCTRSNSDTSAGDTTTSAGGATTTAAADPTALAAGGFGDMEKVCQPGDASGATDVGVTDTEIHAGTLTDKGFSGRPGLTKEMYDSALAFTKWCNEHGGILGRKIVLDDRDAALTEYNTRILESCTADLAMVGGGAVLDNSDNGARVQCGLPNFAGYVVTPEARAAELQVQPMPNPIGYASNAMWTRARTMFPALTQFGIMTGAIQTTEQVRDADLKVAEQAGYTTVYNKEYNVNCEPDWSTFVSDMKNAGTQVLHFVGEPGCLIGLQKAMDTAGWFPDLTLQETNFYDTGYAQEAGAFAKNTYVRTAFYPFELAADNKATQDYLDLMKQYNPDGRIATLGVQGLSAWLLFAKAATECGSQLTRTCVLDKAKTVTEWTGGGLHGATNPSTNMGTACFAALKLGPTGFTYDKEFTGPTPGDGIYNCDPENIVKT